MSPSAGSGRRGGEPAERSPSPGATTREVLIELAAEVFATEGYASASVRDLSRRAGVTSGAIYGNFRGQGGLARRGRRLPVDHGAVDAAVDVTSQSLVDIVAYQFEHFDRRKQLMSLLLEGAVAAPHDEHLRGQLRRRSGAESMPRPRRSRLAAAPRGSTKPLTSMPRSRSSTPLRLGCGLVCSRHRLPRREGHRHPRAALHRGTS